MTNETNTQTTMQTNTPTDSIVHAQNLHKSYGKKSVLKGIDLDIKPGEIVGLIGPNGAGKTTLLKAMLGLAPYDGSLTVNGKNPKTERVELMKEISFVADTAILPSWLKVKNAIEFMEKTHPRFNRELAEQYLSTTNVKLDMKVKAMSKGMITLTHLCLVMAIDSDLLVLDEPTLGLDIVNRKQFYQRLLNDYFDKNKTILVTTHQVEEIENILTRAVFIDDGDLVLDESIDEIAENYIELSVQDAQFEEALKLEPFKTNKSIGGYQCFYKGKTQEELSTLGETMTPSLADLFVAVVTQEEAA